jgi:CRP-like cAMP-binding protein
MPEAVAAPELSAVLAAAFPSARRDTLGLLEAAATSRQSAPGTVLMAPGEASPPMLLVRAGIVARLVRGADGREMASGVIGRGRIAGTTGLARNTRSGTYLVTWTRAWTAHWPPERVRALIRGDAGLATDVLDHAIAVADELAEALDELLTLPSITRLARISLRYPELVFDAERPILSRGNLASLMGTSREMMDRCIRQLEDDRIMLRTAPTGLVLLDHAALAALS